MTANSKSTRQYQLEEGQLEYVIVYAKKDEGKADDLNKRLKSITANGAHLVGFKICETHPFRDWMLMDEFDTRRDLYDRSTFKFFVVTNNLQKDLEYLKEKNEMLARDINGGNASIIPVWYTAKKDLNKETRHALYGCFSLIGVDPNDRRFNKRVQEMYEMKTSRDQKETREKDQKKKLDEYLENLENKQTGNIESSPQDVSQDEPIVAQPETDDTVNSSSVHSGVQENMEH